MTRAVLDDHLLRDLLSDQVSADLVSLLGDDEPATTNLYFFRLCRSVLSALSGTLTGSWSSERRRALGRALLALPEEITIVPMRSLGFRMAELAEAQQLSSLGAEAVVAAEHLEASLVVREGDDGPRIRAATKSVGADYRTISR